MVNGKTSISFTHLFIVVCAIVFITLVVSPVFAESIFLKDGSIIEGDIVKETDKATTVKTKEGKNVVIPRKDILRTLMHEDYKTKMYIMKSDKSVLQVYIVEEDNENYRCRFELQSPDEFSIKKKDVISVSKVSTDVLIEEKVKEEVKKYKKATTRKEKLQYTAPMFRIGLSPAGKISDKDISDNYETGRHFIADAFYRFRAESGSGLDAMFRFRVLELSPTNDLIQDSANIGSIFFGLRYAFNILVTNAVIVQFYPFALYQFVFHGNFEDPTGEEYKASRHGYQFGAGVDIGLFPTFGIFAEYAIGYVGVDFPDKTRNTDGQFVYIGASYRTTFLD